MADLFEKHLVQANYRAYSNSVQQSAKRYHEYPRTVSIETLVRCNAKCNFCPYPKSPRQEERLDTDLFFKILHELRDIPEAHSFQITLCRINEPLLDDRLLLFSDLIARYLPQAKQAFWSNGTTLVPGRFEWMGKKYQETSLTISLNSMEEASHREMMGFGLQKVQKNLDYLHSLIEQNQFNSRVIVCAPYLGPEKSNAFCEAVTGRWPRFTISLRPLFGWTGADGAGRELRDQYGLPNQVAPEEIDRLPCAQWCDLHILANGFTTKCCIDEAGYRGQLAYNTRLRHVLDIYREGRGLRNTMPGRGEVAACQGCLHLG